MSAGLLDFGCGFACRLAGEFAFTGARAFSLHGGVDFSYACVLQRDRKTLRQALRKRIKPRLHVADAFKKPRIHQGCNGFAIFVDDDAVFAVMHLVEHVSQVLAEADRGGFCDLDALLLVTMTDMVKMIKLQRLSPSAQIQFSVVNGYGA